MHSGLSVIVPIYDIAPFLPPCIESIMAQTFTDFELILVDDGNTDGSSAILINTRKNIITFVFTIRYVMNFYCSLI